MARQTKRNLGWKYVWTYHGNVFMRKSKEEDSIKIATKHDLDKMQQQNSSTINSNNG